MPLIELSVFALAIASGVTSSLIDGGGSKKILFESDDYMNEFYKKEYAKTYHYRKWL